MSAGLRMLLGKVWARGDARPPEPQATAGGPDLFPMHPRPSGRIFRCLPVSQPAERQRSPSCSVPEHPQPAKARTKPEATVCHCQRDSYQNGSRSSVRKNLLLFVGFIPTSLWGPREKAARHFDARYAFALGWGRLVPASCKARRFDWGRAVPTPVQELRITAFGPRRSPPAAVRSRL